MLSPASLRHPTAGTTLVQETLASTHLGREVIISVLLPPAGRAAAPFPVLYLNDGQDLERLGLQATLDALYAGHHVQPFVVVALHANEARMHEYGTAGQPDFNGRGSRAQAYSSFVLDELVPFAQATYQVDKNPQNAVIAGFSLGGLSAFDLAWHHPETFARAGVFSGSFWWRQCALEAGYTAADRIMHARVRARPAHPCHRFWLQTGTLDERADRNENGVIDSIEDCLDLIEELVAQGLDVRHSLRYVQVEGGHHHPGTWGQVMPDFLCWAFGAHEAAAGLPAPLPVVRLQLSPAPVPPEHAPAAPEAAAAAAAVSGAAAAAAELSINILPSHAMPIARPVDGDFLPYAASYVNQVPEGADPRETLHAVGPLLHELLDNLNEAQAETAYAPGKWTLKEMLAHQIDTERIFAYRAMRFARGDSQDLPGFDQDEYVANSGANARSLSSLFAEYDATRAATIALFESFTEEQLDRRGTANGGPTTVRALLFIVPGHELHHLHLIRERYLPIL